MTGRDLVRLRALPRPVRPYPDETTASLIRRLATANAITSTDIQSLLHQTRAPWGRALAALTHYDERQLILAMPQLGTGTGNNEPALRLPGRPDRPDRHAAGVACHRCTLARGAGNHVAIYTTHDRTICPRHRLWLGEGTYDHQDQIPLQACPELPAAFHHHRNLIARFGRTTVRKAFFTANTIHWRWHDQGRQPGSITVRYRALVPTGDLSWARRRVTAAAALYPSVVDLTAAIASPFWAEIAHSSQPDKFLHRISSQITGGWIPQGSGDPLRHWMETDWQPGFTGPDTLQPPEPR